MNRFFVLGNLFWVSTYFYVQDTLGKEKYIESINSGWVDTPAWIWIPVMLAIGLIAVVFDIRQKRHIERLEMMDNLSGSHTVVFKGDITDVYNARAGKCHCEERTEESVDLNRKRERSSKNSGGTGSGSKDES